MQTAPSGNRAKVFWWGALGAILLVAAGLRLAHLDWAGDHFDERIAVGMSRHLESTPGWDTNWKHADIPPFSGTDQYNFSAYLYATHLFRRASQGLSGAEWLRRREGLLAHRLFAGLCGIAAVAVGALAARRLGGGAVGLVAGGLLALNPQLVQDAHYGRPEAFMTLLFAGVLWLGGARRWSRGTVMMMAGLAGLMTATKSSHLLLLGVLLACLGAEYLAREEEAEPALGRATALAWIAAAVGAFGVGWLVGVPAVLWNGAAYFSGVRELAGQYAGGHPPHSLVEQHAVWPMLAAYYRATWGWSLLLLVVAGGVVLAARRKRRTWLLLAAPTLATVALFGAQKVFFERNLSPVVPAALVLAAIGLVALVDWLVSVGRRRGVVLAVASLAVALPGGVTTWRLVGEALSGEDSRRLEAHFADLRRDFPEVRWLKTTLTDEADLAKIRRELTAARGELLVTLIDYHDTYTARWLPAMGLWFQLQAIADHRGVFADYPTSTLNVMHGPRWRTYLVRPR